MAIKPNKQPCAVCREHKAKKPFKIRADNGQEFEVSHICNCPYCGRFLAENYKEKFDENGEGVSDNP